MHLYADRPQDQPDRKRVEDPLREREGERAEKDARRTHRPEAGGKVFDRRPAKAEARDGEHKRWRDRGQDGPGEDADIPPVRVTRVKGK